MNQLKLHLLLFAFVFFCIISCSNAYTKDDNGLVELTDANFQEVVMDTSKDVFVEFYSPRCGYCIKLIPLWEELGRKFKDEDSVIIAKIDGTQYKIPGHTVDAFPTLKMFTGTNKDGVEYTNHHRTLNMFVEFVLLYASHPVEVTITYKSQALPEPNEGPVTILVGKNFNDVVMNPHHDVVVNFFAPWCPYSVQLDATWQALGERLKDIPSIIVAKYDDTQNEVPGVHVHAYPTIVFYPAESKDPHVFRGFDRQLNNLMQFVMSHAIIPFVDPVSGLHSKNVHIPERVFDPTTEASFLVTDENFDEIVQKKENNVFLAFVAPWCSHSQELDPIWTELAKEFSTVSGVTIAKMDASRSKKVQISMYPTIRMYPAVSPTEEKQEPVEYRGAKTVQDLSNFILKFSNRAPVMHQIANTIQEQEKEKAAEIKNEEQVQQEAKAQDEHHPTKKPFTDPNVAKKIHEGAFGHKGEEQYKLNRHQSLALKDEL